MDNIAAQIVGFFGAAVYFMCFQQKKRSRILLLTVVASLIFVVHFLMLGAYTGAVLNAVNAVKSIVYYYVNPDKPKSKIWLALFIVAAALSGILTWSDWFSVFPMASMIVASISFWMKSETKIRLLTLPTSPSWFLYNMHIGSVSGMVTEVIISSSLIIAIIRYDIIGKLYKTESGATVHENK